MSFSMLHFLALRNAYIVNETDHFRIFRPFLSLSCLLDIVQPHIGLNIRKSKIIRQCIAFVKFLVSSILPSALHLGAQVDQLVKV